MILHNILHNKMPSDITARNHIIICDRQITATWRSSHPLLVPHHGQTLQLQVVTGVAVTPSFVAETDQCTSSRLCRCGGHDRSLSRSVVAVCRRRAAFDGRRRHRWAGQWRWLEQQSQTPDRTPSPTVDCGRHSSHSRDLGQSFLVESATHHTEPAEIKFNKESV